MIAAIVLAYLDKAGQRARRREVWIGIVLAILLAAVGGLLAYMYVRGYDGSTTQAIIEGSTYLVAAAILTYMTFWMKRESRDMKAHLTARVNEAIETGSGLALATLVFTTVLREGIETVVFTLAIALAGSGGHVLLGAALGLGLAFFVSFLIYRMGVRLNLGLFFNVVGSFLMLSAAGLLVDGIEDFQMLGWLPIGTHVLWHTGAVLPETSFLGDMLHSFFGYAQAPTVLQAILYAVYLAVVLLFLWRQRLSGPPRQESIAEAS